MIRYWEENANQMVNLAFEHAELVIFSLMIAIGVAFILVIFFLQRKNWLNSLIYVFSLLYSIPSYAFFALLIPATGLGKTSAIIALAFYSEYVLLHNFITGIRKIDLNYIEIARGMGMTNQQIFFKIQLPLAVPAIFSGIRIALASTMSIATIAATINAGGLGELIFEGLQTGRIVPILWGIILTVMLTFVCIIFLRLVENLFEVDFSRNR